MEQCPYCAKGIPMPDVKISEDDLNRWQDIERRLVEKRDVSKEERTFYFSRLDEAQSALLRRKMT